MRLRPQGKKRIDAVLEAHAGKDLPALFCVAATKDAVIYKECRGDKVFGRPEEGPASFDNSQFGGRPRSRSTALEFLSCASTPQTGLTTDAQRSSSSQ